MDVKRNPLACAISCAVAASALGISPPVLSQDQIDQEQAEEEIIETVLVVGSRIRKSVFSHSTPIDVINTDVTDTQGVADIGNLLQGTTVAAGSAQITPAISSAFVTNGGTGAQTLSLRGLGANRTLTLLNGRRVGPAGTRGGVSSFDLNVLPLSAIERIEILKDGASSIYGSDAVAGVVNIITKKEDGLTVEAFVGQPAESGGEETRFSASWGKTFDRGRVRLTADYHLIEDLNMRDRDFLMCPEMYIFDPDTGARRDPIDPRTGRPLCRDARWGHIWIYDYSYFYTDDVNIPAGAKAQFDYDGDLGNYVPDNPLGMDPDNPWHFGMPPGWFMVNYDRPSDSVTNWLHPFYGGTTFFPETERTTLFADAEIQLSDGVDLYAEVLMNRRQTDTNGYRQFWGYVYTENWFYDYGNPLAAGWTGAGTYLSPTTVTDHYKFAIDVDYQRYVLGLKGEFENGWIWDLSYQYSNSDGDYSNDVIYNDSVRDQDWLYGSCEGTVTSVRGVPCLDIPWLDPQFLAGNVSPEMRGFLFGRETGNTDYTQWSVEGFVSGEWFELPGGDLGLAVGFHYRDDEILDVPGPITLANNSWGLTSAGITAGSDTTTAFFAEVDLPLVQNQPGVKFLNLNASARYTDVDSYGSDTTYKVGLNWQITDSVRFRANKGTSFRTPALFELYLENQTSFLSQRFIDPCINWGAELAAGGISQRVADNCAATTVPGFFPDGLPPDFPGAPITATIIEGGGFGILEAETSDSFTAGFIWTPGFANLSVSLDYFDIQVDDQVDQISAGGIVGGCYNSEFWPNDPLCALFDRSLPGGGIDNVRDSFINIATQSNKGWDLAFRYETDLAGGHLSIDSQFTYQDEAVTALFEDTVRDNNGEFGEPEWVGRLWTTYDRGDWEYFWGVDMIGDVSNFEDYGGTTATYRGETVRVVLDADAQYYHALSVTRDFRNGLRATLGVRNALDEEPPRVTTLGLGQLTTAGISAFYSQYDFFGRRFFVNLSWDLN
jgi:iron complex outermembrane receptor protein